MKTRLNAAWLCTQSATEPTSTRPKLRETNTDWEQSIRADACKYVQEPQRPPMSFGP